MAQTKTEILAMLAKFDRRPHHRFGQNFMIDGNLVRLIAESAQTSEGDLAVEVGPGTGTLTEELLARTPHVVAVEIDRDMAAIVRERFSSQPRFAVIEGDALDGKHALHHELLTRISEAKAIGKTVRLCANLPYNIASPLIIELLLAGVESLTFTVQKEVAERLKAPRASDNYGPLSIMAQLLSEIQILRTIGPGAFWPSPKVDSALVRMTRRGDDFSQARPFSTFVQKIFSARRKTMRNALAVAGVRNPDGLLERASLSASVRPQELDVDQILRLFEATP